MSLRKTALVGTGAVLLCAAALIAAPPAPSRLSLYHWWTSPSEVAAFKALSDLFTKKYPDVVVAAANAPGSGSMGMFPVIKGLAQAGHAPETFQLNAGYAMQPFLDAGLLAPIDPIWQSEGLEKVFPPVVRDLNKLDGHYYSVPIGVHRKNVIWYNKALLDRYEIDPTTLTTWDAFFRATDKLKTRGIGAPIALADGTVAQVFEAILASQGMGTYEDWINGRIRAGNDARMLQAFGTFKTYVGYSNRDHGELAWEAALKRVMKGEGAFCLIGDWANGEFRLAGMKYGRDYGALLVPGTRGMFGLSLDTFQHPRRSSSEGNAERWLKLAASREGQDAFNPLKGSIPARIDADVNKYDTYQRSTITDLAASRLVYPSIAQAAPNVYYTRLTEVLTAFVSDLDVNKGAAALAAATTQFSAKYTRVWSLK
jgi:glucose/mannose transport system substrate-binding protein